MTRMTAGMRIAVVLTMWSATTLLGLRLLGVFDDGHDEQVAARIQLCETVAVACSEMRTQGRDDALDATMAALVERNEDVLSAGIRGRDGQLARSYGVHDVLWPEGESQQLSNTCIYVPMFDHGVESGRVEVCFRPIVNAGIAGFMQMPSVRTLVLMTMINFVAFAWCLRYCLRSLDPNQVVPDRVRSALDTIAEGLVIVDEDARIVLTNDAFAQMIQKPKSELQDVALASLPFAIHETEKATTLPWEGPTTDAASPTKVQLVLGDTLWTMMANAAPVYDDHGELRGKLISLNDITALEQNRAELQAAMEALEQSNEQLEYLATRDPMTGCLNRRSFFQIFESQWKAAQRYQVPLSCIMVDVDHFKSINDTHGHAMGDEVLIEVAKTLLKCARDTDFVCRYGGEEFCVLLPHENVDGTKHAAERIRKAISEITILPITASLGVSDRSFAAETPEAMLEQADQCLYVAKRNGRNQVVTYRRVLEESGGANDQELLDEVKQLQDEAQQAGEPSEPSETLRRRVD